MRATIIGWLCVLTGCGSVHKTQHTKSAAIDSLHTLKSNSLVYSKNDHTETSIDSGYIYKTLTFEFDTTSALKSTGQPKRVDSIDLSDFSPLIGKYLSNGVIYNNSTGHLKKITITELEKNNKSNYVVDHSSDSNMVHKSDSSAIKSVQKESDNNVTRKKPFPIWVWFIIVLVFAAIIYRYRWQILELFKF